MYKAKVAICSDIRTKHSTRSEHHVEFLNVLTWWYVKKPLGFKRLTVHFCPVLPSTTSNNSALFTDSETSPVCPSNKNSIKMRINTNDWRDGTDREN